jgi:hypothetical protein
MRHNDQFGADGVARQEDLDSVPYSRGYRIDQYDHLIPAMLSTP